MSKMLDIDIAARGSLSRYEYLYRRLREMIVGGALAPEDRLPSKRALASELGVSLITVENAYAQLVAEGYVTSRPRSGYYVTRLPGLPSAPSRSRTRSAKNGGREPEEAAPVPFADFTGAGTGMRPAAARLWSRALRQALTKESEREAFSPVPAHGSLRLRRAIAEHLGRTRGMDVDPECVVVGAGAQLLDVHVVQLLGPEVRVGVEDPGYERVTRIYRAAGAQVSHIPLDKEGVVVAELAKHGVDLLHLMPSHQFPTGRVTSIARRFELLGWASAAPGRYLVEDDYDCEFRLAGRPVASLASIDTEGRVIYTNTFTKSLGAALRLAYMVLPPRLMERYRRELGFYSSTVSSVAQLALARLLESGDYERHVMRERKRHRELRDALLHELRASGLAGCMGIEEADSGLHFVLALDAGAAEEEVARAASAEGVALAPRSRFAQREENRMEPDGLARFVIDCGALDPTRIPEAVARLERAVACARRGA